MCGCMFPAFVRMAIPSHRSDPRQQDMHASGAGHQLGGAWAPGSSRLHVSKVWISFQAIIHTCCARIATACTPAQRNSRVPTCMIRVLLLDDASCSIRVPWQVPMPMHNFRQCLEHGHPAPRLTRPSPRSGRPRARMPYALLHCIPWRLDLSPMLCMHDACVQGCM